MDERIAVIGAGIAGLALARRLAKAGAAVTVFEKAAVIGGRLATEATPFGGFDTAAQYVSARGPAFRAFLARASAMGASAVWRPVGKDRNDEWHVGIPGMSGLVMPLRDGFSVQHGAEVTAVERAGDAFSLVLAGAGEPAGPFARVIAAVPAARASALLGHFGAPFDRIASEVAMGPCWALLAAFDARLPIEADIVRRPEDDLAWAARNGSKPERQGETWVGHAAIGWSRANRDADEAAVREGLLRRLDALAGPLPPPTHARVQLWSEALVERPLGAPFLLSEDRRLGAAGDWCLAARAEAAFQSAEELAATLLPAVEEAAG